MPVTERQKRLCLETSFVFCPIEVQRFVKEKLDRANITRDIAIDRKYTPSFASLLGCTYENRERKKKFHPERKRRRNWFLYGTIRTDKCKSIIIKYYLSLINIYKKNHPSISMIFKFFFIKIIIFNLCWIF